jgi:serine/threonine protein kinase
LLFARALVRLFFARRKKKKKKSTANKLKTSQKALRRISCKTFFPPFFFQFRQGTMSEHPFIRTPLNPNDFVAFLNAEGSLGFGFSAKIIPVNYRGVERALKLVDLSNNRIRDEFKREITVYESVKDKNVCGYFGAGVHQNKGFILLERADGDLLNALKSRTKYGAPLKMFPDKFWLHVATVSNS